MELYLKRKESNEHETGGEFYIGPQKMCDTLEDEYRVVKVKGDTRIPSGRYRVKLRKEGLLNEKYAKRFPEMHKGMLHITGIPSFEYVYIHIGNTDADTAGCPLVGTLVKDDEGGRMALAKSTDAYTLIYPLIAKELLAGKEVWINVEDEK